MRISRIGVGFLAGVCLLWGAASAESSVQYSQSGKQIILSGTMQTDKPGEVIGITVMPEDAVPQWTEEDEFLYVDWQESRDGNFSFTLELEDSTCEATAWIWREYGQEPFPFDFVYRSTADVETALSALNAANTPAEAEEALKRKNGDYTNAFVLNVHTELLDDMELPYDNIYQAVLDGKPYTAQEFSRVGEIFKIAVRIEQLSRSRDSKWIREVLEQEGETLGAVVEDDVFEKIKKDRIGEIDGVYRKMAERTFSNRKELRQAYMESVALTAVESPKAGRFDVQYVLRSCKNELKIQTQIDRTEKLSDIKKSGVYSAVSGVEFPSVQALASRLEQLCREAEKESAEVPSRPSGSGGGGGFGGGGGGTVISNPQEVKPVPPLESAEPEGSEKQEAFSDMTDASWAKEAVYAMHEMGVVNGRADGTFAPNECVTREEFVKMTVLIAGGTKQSEIFFSDVPNNAWYAEYVRRGVAMGITTGISEEQFGAGMPITRQDMAVMLYRMAEKMGVSFPDSEELMFSDAEIIADYAREAVSVLSGSGIINGNPDGGFAPNQSATRAEAAAMLYRIISLKEA